MIILAFMSFAQVFALGFQSRNVNHGNYGLAWGTSFLIGIMQASVWQRLTGPNVGWGEVAIYACSGAMGIVSAMYAHKRWVA